MTVAVLDASAVLALLFGETGADAIRPRVRGGLIATVNLAEVLAKLVDKGVPAEQAQLSAALRSATRSAGLSLGDRACLTLARERGLPAITAERRWPEIAEQAGVAIEVIR